MLTHAEVLALEGRGLDAAVAEFVFGLELFHRLGIAFIQGETGLLGNLTPRRYHADASADYEVLCHIRETWDADRQHAFSKRLEELWVEHAPGNRVWVSLDFEYRPGDWSRAALLTLAREGE